MDADNRSLSTRVSFVVIMLLTLFIVTELFVAAYVVYAGPRAVCKLDLPRRAIPLTMVSGILAQEDDRFFNHWGVNLREVKASIVKNIKHRKIVRGASTIDMQAASLCFDHAQVSSRWYGKLREVFLALWMNLRFEKSEILCMYISGAPLGSVKETVGFVGASRHYFGRLPQALTLEQQWRLILALRNKDLLHPRSWKHPEDLPKDIQANLKRAKIRSSRLLVNLRRELTGTSWVGFS